MKIEKFNFEQRSDEWFDARKGVITSSRFKDVLAKGAVKTRKSYMYELASEYLTGEKEIITNKYIEFGIENECNALKEYENETGNIVEKVGFYKCEELNVGSSPDGLIEKNGIIEIKCPKTTTHIKRIEDNVFPKEYMAQVQGQLWLSERTYCDFVSFDPRIPSKSKLFIKRVERDDDFIKNLKEEIENFNNELQKLIFILS